MMHWMRLREEELVERLYEAADAVEDEDVRDDLYRAISAGLEVWAPMTPQQRATARAHIQRGSRLLPSRRPSNARTRCPNRQPPSPRAAEPLSRVVP
jgi:hypothetical protein